ncbi:MAG: GNAT family N-acetyltransferase, partial [Hyphomicrobiales bacterium]|nr:GNAT family N-acetyltransferase [Hyphomicrobiales bacterium]
MHAPAIRTGRPSDLAAIHALETQVFESDRLTRAALRGHLASVREPVIVAELDGRLVGYALVVMRRDSAAARLYSLGVSGDAAGRGVGSALLAECEARAAAAGARSMRLEVRRDNRAAIALYERRGYRRFGRYDDFYTDGEAAWRYEKRLLAPAAGVVAPA